jgi:glutathione S-transferase
MKLYYAPRTPAIRPRWLLEELQADYELVDAGPLERAPALVDGNVKLTESGAICAYIADACTGPDGRKLAPAVDSANRKSYVSWLFRAVSKLEPAILDASLGRKDGREKLEEEGRAISQSLADKDYLIGSFTAADVMVGSMLASARALDLLADSPKLDAYVERLTSRGAFQRAAQSP